MLDARTADERSRRFRTEVQQSTTTSADAGSNNRAAAAARSSWPTRRRSGSADGHRVVSSWHSGARRYVAAKHRVEVAVSVFPIPPLSATNQALLPKSGAFECSLLGQVVDIGVSLDAVDRSVREEQLRKRSLSRTPDAASASARSNPDPDHRTPRRLGRPPMHVVPGHIAGHHAVVIEYYETASVVKTGRADTRTLSPRTKVVELAVAAGQECKITRSLGPQHDGHSP
jgi:hypothetical protein